MKSPDHQAPTVQVLARSFAVLDVLAQHAEPVPLKTISNETGLHPSTAHRILNDLVAGRWVDRPEAGNYRLGMRLLELGNLVKARLDVREAAIKPMRLLQRLTHHCVSLSARQGDEIVCIGRESSQPMGAPPSAERTLGARAPLHLTSVGKLFLAQDDSQLVRAYATRSGLIGHTHNSITNISVLERELSQVLALGMARNNEELELGSRCMAIGICNDQGVLVAGLSISAPTAQFDDQWLEPLRQAADQISLSLGYQRNGLALTASAWHSPQMLASPQAPTRAL